MSVLIPWTRIRSFTPRPVLFSGNQEGSLGGADLPVPHLGDRWAVDVKTTQFRQDAESRRFIALLFEALTADARIAIRQPNLGSPSMIGASVVVDGGAQAGSLLALRNAQEGAVVRHGQLFSLVNAGVHQVFMSRAQVVVNGARKVVVPVWPMLRTSPADGASVAIDQPMIEGRLTGGERGATFERNRVDPLEFTIAERS